MRILLPLLVACCCWRHREQQTPRSRRPASLLDAERPFARTAAQLGIRDSFLEYLADDAIALGPEAKRAKDD